MANYNQLLSMAKKLRAEKDKSREYETQKEEQKNLLNQLESRRQRLQNQLTENRQINSTASGQNLLQKAEDAIRVNQYVIEKNEKEIQQKTDSLILMEKVLLAPNPSQSEIQQINQKVNWLINLMLLNL